MRMHVDAWDPAYGSGVEPTEDGPSAASTADLDTDVELPAADWHPLVAPADVETPDVVLFVDGVRRIDARVWLEADDHAGPSGLQSYAGIAASYASGVVRCDLRKGVADLAIARVERGLFTAAPDPEDVGTPPTRYIAHQLNRGEISDLVNGVQQEMLALELRVSAAAREDSADDLLVVDGPLRGRAQHRALGYVKTHRREYLPDRLSAVVTALAPGQRSPIFLLGGVGRRYTWYLRLPAPLGAAWSGIVRVECPVDLDVPAAIAIAHLSTVTLPRFASVPYKDPRAPQNLVPIAGLERRLRSLLGDARLLQRSLARAAAVRGPGSVGASS
jgi:uncharacterized protein